MTDRELMQQALKALERGGYTNITDLAEFDFIWVELKNEP